MDNDKVSCPICSKVYPVAVIENHASKCLFLNESTSKGVFESFKDNSSTSKTIRSTTTKPRKLSLENKGKSTVVESTFLSSPEPKEHGSRFSEIVPIDNASKKTAKKDNVPLAEKMRPSTLSKYVGQSHIIGPNTMLSQLLEKAEIPNIILWGPPGCGKTSLAAVIANICHDKTNGKIRYVKLSAAMVGVNEVKQVVNVASNELKFGRRTVIFLDEIHRFNKTQQDVFLPHVEAGTVALIGATTENPSFSLNSALLSRCRVVVLEKLSTSDLLVILKRAVSSSRGVIHNPEKRIKLEDTTEDISKFIIDEATVQWLAESSDGDARIALGGLELVMQAKVPNEEEFLKNGPVTISLDDVKEGLKKTHMLYDRKGEQHYDMISALHKSVRASDENAAIYWLTRMLLGGEDPVYIARRLVRMATEDVGLADPKALGVAMHTMHGCKMIGMPECDVLLAQCTTYLAKAPKSRLMEDALRAAQRVVNEHKGPQPGVPLHLRNAPTKLMKNLGYGSGYNMRDKEKSGLNYMPEELEGLDFFGGNQSYNS